MRCDGDDWQSVQQMGSPSHCIDIRCRTVAHRLSRAREPGSLNPKHGIYRKRTTCNKVRVVARFQRAAILFDINARLLASFEHLASVVNMNASSGTFETGNQHGESL
jgi:hypothetical protein